MKSAYIALWLAAAVPAWAQETPEDLRRQIEAKRKELDEKTKKDDEFLGTILKDEEKLMGELGDLWKKLNGPPPSTFIAEASVRYTFWDHDLGIEDGPGLGLDFVLLLPSSLALTEIRFGSDGSVHRQVSRPGLQEDGSVLRPGLQVGLRRWRIPDERASGDVDVYSYRLIATWMDRLAPNNYDFGVGISMSFGLTRFDSDAPGGDHDTALDLSIISPRLEKCLGRGFYIDASLEWDIMRTSFNQDRTRTSYAIAPLISIEYSF